MMEFKQPRQAIIDTSVLLSLYHLNLLHFLSLLYLEVRVPREVEKEFLENPKDEIEKSSRYDFIAKFYDTNRSWFSPCNEYGFDLVEIYLADKELDKGEAEVFAQNQSLGSSHELLLDERKGRQVAKSESVKHHGVLYILANLDLRFQCCTYYESLKELKKANIGRFSDTIVNLVYETEREQLFLN